MTTNRIVSCLVLPSSCRAFAICGFVAAFLVAMTCRASAIVIYANGDLNKDINGYPVYENAPITNSFVSAGSASLASAEVAFTTFPQDTPATVSWEVGTHPFTSNISAGTSTLTNTFQGTGPGFFTIYDCTFLLNGVLPSAGTYYFTLFNARDNEGHQTVFWNENDGPSTASQGAGPSGADPVTIGSEAFVLFGTATPATAVPDQGTTAVLLGAAMLGLLAFRSKFGAT